MPLEHGSAILLSSFLSFQCQLNDTIAINEKVSSKKLVKNNLKMIQSFAIPDHLSLDKSKLEAKITNYSNREDNLLNLNELLVIEYYSRR